MSTARNKYIQSNGETFTVWRRSSGGDWRDDDNYEGPRHVLGCYDDEPKLVKDQQGEDFAPKMTVLCKEADDIRRGDYILRGESIALKPTADAGKVRQVGGSTNLKGGKDAEAYAV